MFKWICHAFQTVFEVFSHTLLIWRRPGANPKISWLLKWLYIGNSVFEESTTNALLKIICSPACKRLQTLTNVSMTTGIGAPRSYWCACNSPFSLHLLQVWPPTPPQQHKGTMTDHQDHLRVLCWVLSVKQVNLDMSLNLFNCAGNL